MILRALAYRFRYFLHRHHVQRQRQLHWVQLSAATKGAREFEWSSGASNSGVAQTANVGAIKLLFGDALDKAGDIGARGAISLMRQAAKRRQRKQRESQKK